MNEGRNKIHTDMTNPALHWPLIIRRASAGISGTLSAGYAERAVCNCVS